MKRALQIAASAGCTLFALCGSALADPVLGKVEALYVMPEPNVLVEYKPGMRTHDLPRVADVRLRDAGDAGARRIMLRLDDQAVERGDIVAVDEGERGNFLRTAPLRSRDRLAHIEAKHDTPYARNFFGPAPAVLAFRKAD